MTYQLKQSLQPAKDVLGTNGTILTPGQLRDTLDSIVNTLDLLVAALDAYATAQIEQAALKKEEEKVIQVPQDTPLLPPEPGLEPNPLSPDPKVLNSPGAD